MLVVRLQPEYPPTVDLPMADAGWVEWIRARFEFPNTLLATSIAEEVVQFTGHQEIDFRAGQSAEHELGE